LETFVEEEKGEEGEEQKEEEEEEEEEMEEDRVGPPQSGSLSCPERSRQPGFHQSHLRLFTAPAFTCNYPAHWYCTPLVGVVC
jgi:hypothetical protein